MYFSYGFERKHEAKSHTLNRLAAWAAQHDNTTLFLVFMLDDRAEFERIKQTYGGKIAWIQELTTGPLGFLSSDNYAGLITFDCRNPAADPVGAFFSTEETVTGLAVVTKNPECVAKIQPIIVAEHTASIAPAGENDPQDFVDKLMAAGASVVYQLDLPGTEILLDEAVHVNDADATDCAVLIRSLD